MKDPADDKHAEAGPVGTGSAGTELELAAESIRSTTSGGPKRRAKPSLVGRLVSHVRLHDKLYALAFAVVSIVIAALSVVVTLQQFKRQLVAQQRASAEQVINQFFVQFAELTTLASDRNDEKLTKQVDTLIVSRAQMLIDGEDTGVYAGDILRFLSTNDFGHYIGRDPGTEHEPRIDIDNSAFHNLKLDSAELQRTSFRCLQFDASLIQNVRLVEGKIQHVKFSDSLIASTSFENSWLGHIDFAGVTLESNLSFVDTTLYSSDLSNVKFGSSFGKSSSGHEYLAERLAEATSLYRTRIHSATDQALREQLDIATYKEKVLTRPKEMLVDEPGMVDRAYLAIKWRESCRSIRRRI